MSHASGSRLADIGGDVQIGSDVLLISHPVRSHLFADPGGRIVIGNGVRVSYGAAIAAREAVEIGAGTTIGPFVVIMDNDFHKVGDRHAAGAAAPVRIGSNVSIGARVTILRGSIIGDGARVLSGSMVSGVVPDHATVGGVPARVLDGADRPRTGTSDAMVELVQQVLGLATRPAVGDGPTTLPEWDSLGSLRLLLAIEAAFGVNIPADVMQSADTIAALTAIVQRSSTIAAGPASRDMCDLVQAVLGLSSRPSPDQGPGQIPEWDSLGALRLLLAIEDAYGVSISEAQMRSDTTIAALSAMVAAKA